MAPQFNAPPGWPQPPADWTPDASWKPDPSWPPAPPGWAFWVEDDATTATPSPLKTRPWSARHWILAPALAFLAGGLLGNVSGQGSAAQGVAAVPSAPPVTITAPPVTRTAPPATVTAPPLTLTAPAVTVTTTVEAAPPAQPAGFASVPAAAAQTDPRFSTCNEARANGHGPYRSGVDPEYDWYRDGDDDGVVCES